MRQFLGKYILLELAIAATVGVSNPSSSFAQDSSGGVVAAQKTHHHERGKFKAFRMGMCVGQNLAKQGIILQPGQPKDPSVKAAIDRERKVCHDQFKTMKAGSSSPNAGSGSQPQS